MAQTLSERLADYVCGLSYARIPSVAIAHLKTTMTCDLLAGVLGSGTPEAIAALRFIDSDIGKPGPCTVIGRRAKASVLDATFANVIMMRALRQQSTMAPGGINAASITIPVALALAEYLGRGGREVLTALVAGFDVCGKLDRAAPEKRTIRTVSHVYGTFAAAAVAAKLLRLDVAQTATALAYAGNLALMIMAGFDDHQYGLLARNGLTAAYLGQSGAPAPRDAFEGVPGFYHAQLAGTPQSFDAVLASLGVEYEVMGCVSKTFPGGISSTVCAAVLQSLRTRECIVAEQLSRIVVYRPAETNDHLKHASGPFANDTEALQSVPLAVAAVLVDGTVTLRRLRSSYNDPAVLRVTQLVEFVDVASERPFYHRIELHTRDGRTLSATGDCDMLRAPEPRDIARFHRSPLLDEARAADLAATVAQLESLESLDALTAHLIR